MTVTDIVKNNSASNNVTDNAIHRDVQLSHYCINSDTKTKITFFEAK